MKKLFLTSILITIFMLQTKAQTTDLQSIEETIGFYLEGMTNHNAKSIEKAFTPTATMKWVDEKFIEVNAVEALSGYLNSNPVTKVSTTILAVNIAGDAANAQLELEYETFWYIDFMHLLKIDGEWKIVSKTYSTRQKDAKE